MNPKDYSLFKKFIDSEETKAFTSFLNENDIRYQEVDNSPIVDITFANNPLDKETQILVHKDDYERLQELQQDLAKEALNQVDEGYYLLEFTDEELYDVVLKKDEWGPFDYQLAQKLLKERGKEVNPELLTSLERQRIEDLAQPEQGQKPWIYAGYFFSFMGGFIGLLIGWYLWNYRKTLPDGRKVYAYSKEDQNHGRNIFFIGVICFVVFAFLRLRIVEWL